MLVHGPTILISGDNIRKIFKLTGYDSKERLKISYTYSKFAKYITNQQINIILCVVAMYDEPRKWNRLNIDNYVEIYIKSNIESIIKFNKKKIYKKNNAGKLIGIDIKPKYPKNPTIIITNNFKSTPDKLSKKLLNKIMKLKNDKR